MKNTKLIPNRSVAMVVTSIDAMQNDSLPSEKQKIVFANGYDMHTSEPISVRLQTPDELMLNEFIKQNYFMKREHQGNITFSSKRPSIETMDGSIIANKQGFINLSQDQMNSAFEYEMQSNSPSAAQLQKTVQKVLKMETIQHKATRMNIDLEKPNQKHDPILLNFDKATLVANIENRKVYAAKAVTLGGNDRQNDQSSLVLKDSYIALKQKNVDGKAKAEAIVFNFKEKLANITPESSQEDINRNVKILQVAFFSKLKTTQQISDPFGEMKNLEASVNRIPSNQLVLTRGDGNKIKIHLNNIYQEKQHTEDGRTQTYQEPLPFQNAYMKYMLKQDPHSQNLKNLIEQNKPLTNEHLKQAFFADRTRIALATLNGQPQYATTIFSTPLINQVTDSEIKENLQKAQKTNAIFANEMRSGKFDIDIVSKSRYPIAPKMWESHLSKRAEISGGQFSEFLNPLEKQQSSDPNEMVFVKASLPLVAFSRLDGANGNFFAPNIFADYSNGVPPRHAESELTTQAHGFSSNSSVLLNAMSYPAVESISTIIKGLEIKSIDEKLESNLLKDYAACLGVKPSEAEYNLESKKPKAEQHIEHEEKPLSASMSMM